MFVTASEVVMATAFRQGEHGHASGATSTAGRDGYAWWSGLAIVLLGAALLKAHQVASGPHLGTSPFHSRQFLIGAIWLEVLLGGWMLAGLHRRITRWVVIACFGGFAAVALALALGGAESCGCFGRVQVNPWYTSAFDAAVALGVWLFPGPRPLSPAAFTAPGRLIGVMMAAVILAGTLTFAMISSQLSMLDGEGLLPQNGSFMVLRPETWIGRRFPLLSQIRINPQSAELTEGEWLVVLYRQNCSHCQEVIPGMWMRAIVQTGLRVAFVELPPYGSPKESLVGRDTYYPER